MELNTITYNAIKTKTTIYIKIKLALDNIQWHKNQSNHIHKNGVDIR